MKTFWTDELCDHILKCTKQKAELKGLRRYPKTREDLWCYLIVLLGMGLVKFPRIKDYWRQDKADIFGSSYFGKILSGRKYQDFREAIDFDISYVEDYLNYIFKKNWVPTSILVVDECLILFKGRFGGRQHIRGKPHATGLKFYTLADSSGYCYGFWLYHGKDFPSKHSAKQSDIVTEFVESLKNPSPKPVAPDTNSEDLDVLNARFEADLREAEELAAEQHGPSPEEEDEEENEEGDSSVEEPSEPVPFTSGQREVLVIADSYFGSLSCALKLNTLNCFCLLAVRKNVDGDLKNFLCRGLKKHKWRNIYNQEEKLTYCVYNDRAVCSFVSNFCSGSQVVGSVPRIVAFYNKYMNAVDMFDASLHLNYNVHRNQKWTYCLLYALLKMTLVNAWILYSTQQDKSVTHTEFLEQILCEMQTFEPDQTDDDPIAETFSSVFHSQPSELPVDSVASLVASNHEDISYCDHGATSIHHFIKTQGQCRQCVQCKGKKRSNTTLYCSHCKVPLHLNCFQKFHENVFGTSGMEVREFS